MNIVLIGYRGTGKSSVARILGERLSRTVVSTDDEIVRLTGKSIPAIVEESGWDTFRDIESRIIRGLGGEDNLVIDCGGGVVVREENMTNLRKNGKVFWLTAIPGTIIERIKENTDRPSLTGVKSFTEEITEVLEQRRPLYLKYSDYTIGTDSLSQSEIADRILSMGIT